MSGWVTANKTEDSEFGLTREEVLAAREHSDVERFAVPGAHRKGKGGRA